jgi:DNA-binding MarR family transcriptional regulator
MVDSAVRKPGLDGNVSDAMQLLRALVAALTSSARSIEARTGITNAQLFVLRQLAVHPTLSVSDLATRAHTLQGTMSTVVARLATAGFIKKVRSTEDRRRAVLSVTPKGQRTLARAPAPPTEAVLASLALLSPNELQRLTAGLGALVASLGLKVDDVPMLFEESRRRKEAGHRR